MAKDMRGVSIELGNVVVRASKYGGIDICVVTQIVDGKIYLDDSKVPLNYPNRILIVPDNYEK